MKTETLIDTLSFGLRAADAALKRRRPTSPGPDTRADKIVRQVVLPVAERALGRVAPDSARPPARRRRRRLPLGMATLAGALAAGAAAYVVVKQQQRVRERYRPRHAPFPPELLEVLAAPGGAGRLDFNGDR